MWTLRSLLREAEKYLRSRGVPSPRLEAELLLAHALAYDRLHLYTDFDRPVADEERERFRALVLRRVRGEPTAYITGKKEFFSFPFHVAPGVLIPRPETEGVVEVALEQLEGEGEGRVMADLGTGSGCIAVTLLKLRAGLRALAVDRSLAALETARRNAEYHGVGDRLHLFCGDWLGACRAPGTPPLHLVTCNPPYVDPAGPVPCAPEVEAFEPREALFTPPGDPAFHYRRILHSVGPFLAPEGLLLLELGTGLARVVEAEARNAAFRIVGVRRDLQGMDRVLLLARAGNAAGG